MASASFSFEPTLGEIVVRVLNSKTHAKSDRDCAGCIPCLLLLLLQSLATASLSFEVILSDKEITLSSLSIKDPDKHFDSKSIEGCVCTSSLLVLVRVPESLLTDLSVF